MSRNRFLEVIRTGLVVSTAALVWEVTDATREPHITVAGDAAPDFAIATQRSPRVTMKDFRGRVLVLNFWASWCVPCIQETPSLKQFQQAFKASGLVVLGISIDRDEEEYRAFLRRFDVRFETARDPDRKISAAYGTFQNPESYIIGKSGVVAAKVISNQDWMAPDFLRLIKTLL